MNDLQLEDVEDYSADYPPVGYPNADANMAPMGTSDEMYKSSSSSPKYRRGMIIAKLKKNKWTVALLGVVIIILISILVAMAGKGSSSQSGSGSSSSAAGVAPVTVDGASVDQDVLAILKASIQSVYERHGLDTTVLLENAGETPQRKALHWMALDRNVNSMEHTEKMQRFTLATLFYSTNMVKTAYEDEPEAWRKADNWMTNAHSCDWMGVVCGTDKAITSIALAQNRLSGKLPHDLTFIAPKLVSLDFTSNLIVMRGDDYDSFSRMVNLKTLLMDDNYLYYDKGLPPQFKNMVNLEKIRLSYNLFEGVLDSETAVLGSMTKLTHLEMESNFFSGTMPSAIANMNNLMYLYLRRNSMKFNLDFMKAGQLGNLCTCNAMGVLIVPVRVRSNSNWILFPFPAVTNIAHLFRLSFLFCFFIILPTPSLSPSRTLD